jgi:hypothetical protein
MNRGFVDFRWFDITKEEKPIARPRYKIGVLGVLGVLIYREINVHGR